MNESKETVIARSQAWCRAKGELESMLCTYWSMDSDDKYKTFKAAMAEFIKYVEYNGLQE